MMHLYPGKEIAKLNRYTQSFWIKRMKDYDITSAEYPFIIILYHHDGLTQEDIVADLGVDKSAITRSVQSLIKKSIITREKDEVDQRCYRLHLTQKGISLYQPIHNGIEQWNSIVQQNITAEEFKEFNHTLSKILKNVNVYLNDEHELNKE